MVKVSSVHLVVPPACWLALRNSNPFRQLGFVCNREKGAPLFSYFDYFSGRALDPGSNKDRNMNIVRPRRVSTTGYRKGAVLACILWYPSMSQMLRINGELERISSVIGVLKEVIG